MGKIVSLRQARRAKDKAEARAVKEAEAAANRAAFGRTKAEKDATRTEQERENRLHTSHRLERDDDS